MKRRLPPFPPGLPCYALLCPPFSTVLYSALSRAALPCYALLLLRSAPPCPAQLNPTLPYLSLLCCALVPAACLALSLARPQPIGFRATISAPHMHAHALEVLSPAIPQTGGRILDVGCGSGYLAGTMCNAINECNALPCRVRILVGQGTEPWRGGMKGDGTAVATLLLGTRVFLS